MLTQDELAKRLAAFNVEDLSREAKVSTKTIYRLRNKLTAPNFSTLERLLEAMERMSEKVAA
jgi:predicted transcriptional regulator